MRWTGGLWPIVTRFSTCDATSPVAVLPGTPIRSQGGARRSLLAAQRQKGRQHMPNGTAHGREPEPAEEVLDCLAYVQAVRAGDDDMVMAAFDVVHGRLAGRADAMVAPLKLATLILDEAERQGCEVSTLLAVVRARALAERDRHGSQ